MDMRRVRPQLAFYNPCTMNMPVELIRVVTMNQPS
jgi:hypothetical protein